jgi:hypothetical protein
VDVLINRKKGAGCRHNQQQDQESGHQPRAGLRQGHPEPRFASETILGATSDLRLGGQHRHGSGHEESVREIGPRIKSTIQVASQHFFSH